MTAARSHSPRRRALYFVEDRKGRPAGVFVASFGDALNIRDRAPQACSQRGIVVEIASQVRP